MVEGNNLRRGILEVVRDVFAPARFFTTTETNNETTSSRTRNAGRRTKPPLASSWSVAETFNNKAVGGVNADHIEPFFTDGRKAVRRCRPNHDYVAGAGNDLLPIDDYSRLTGEHDTGLGIGMLMQSWAFPWRKVPLKEGNTGTVRLAFELDCGDCAFPLIATIQDVEHSSSSRCWIFGGTPLGAMPEAEAEPA
jgi:hypothetical protein